MKTCHALNFVERYYLKTIIDILCGYFKYRMQKSVYNGENETDDAINAN
jgi:hypothetical protein